MEMGMKLWRAWKSMLNIFTIYSLDRHFPIELFVIWSMSALSNIVAPAHTCSLVLGNVASSTEILKF